MDRSKIQAMVGVCIKRTPDPTYVELAMPHISSQSAIGLVDSTLTLLVIKLAPNLSNNLNFYVKYYGTLKFCGTSVSVQHNSHRKGMNARDKGDSSNTSR